MDNNKSVPVRFRVSEREDQMLDALCNRFGKKASEMWRFMLSSYFQKAFPKYAERKGEKPVIEEPEVSDEQFCEGWGGKVGKSDAGVTCEFRMGGTKVMMLASDRESVIKNGRRLLALKKL